MSESNMSYMLQIATIVITLTLGLISVYQTRRVQHGQNIISITTNYRLKRVEQIREYSKCLLSNTNPILIKQQGNNLKMLQEAIEAAESISSILHRFFQVDREYIELADRIVQLAFEYISSDMKNQRVYLELVYLRNIFKIKCDLYVSADWNRIKRETDGTDTSADSWIEYYNYISKGFAEEFTRLKVDYEESIRHIQ